MILRSCRPQMTSEGITNTWRICSHCHKMLRGGFRNHPVVIAVRNSSTRRSQVTAPAYSSTLDPCTVRIHHINPRNPNPQSSQITIADGNMVHLTKIKESNAHIDKETAPRIAVFVSGTSGIGKITLGAVAKLGTNFKAYVVGRKESKAAFQPFIDELHTANPNASIIWVEGQVTLLSEVKRICDYIRKLETSIDLLFLTTGYVPFFGRESKSVLP